MPIISKETWDKFTQEEKKNIKAMYETMLGIQNTENDIESRTQIITYDDLFGKENLQPQPLTYEDVARELFKEGAWQPHDYASKYDFDENAEPTYFLNCTSQRQAEKLLAINKLLNVAVYLNKNEDGTPWKPDEADGKLWAIGIEKYNKTIMPVEVGVYDYRTEIVYFRTQQLAEQTIQILGEEVIRLGLITEY